jgi:vacuolar-type H+-ATPase subunit I/STV1
VLSIGNFTNQCPNTEEFIQVVHEYVWTLGKKFPGLRMLDYAVHQDEEAHGEESNIHAHLRMCFVHENQAGDFEPNQTQALACMGIKAPKPDEKMSRYNNPMQTFTQQCRELYINIATKHGFIIETEPASPGKITLNKQEYLAVELKRENIALKEEQTELRQQNAVISRKNEALQAQVNSLKKEAKGLRALLRRWKRILTPVKNLFEKLSKIRVSPYRTALDEVLLDAHTATAYDALKELDMAADIEDACI